MLRLFGLVVLSISHMTSAALAAWPDRPITIIVPFAAGGATDVVSRVMADYMRKTLGQPVLVENFGGAGGTIGTGRVANAPADGYTLLMGSLGTQVASVGLYPKLRYDPKKDFAPVIKVVATPMVVSVRKDLPVKDFREFLVYLKQNSSKLNFASGGVGAQSHLLCLYLSYLTNTTPTHVSYRGSGPAMNALMAQDVDFSCDQALGVMPYVGSGIIKPLAVAREKRFAMTPDIPTASEEGLPEFKGDGWLALFAPRDTPAEVVERLNAVCRAALADEEVRKRLAELGNEIPPEADETPDALTKLVDAELEKWLPLIKKSGLGVE